MTLKVYNTLSRKKETFVPVEEGKVKMYVCGMTVYSDVHIGHARTYLAFDVIRRYFEYKGYEVTYVQNITDVDDKIIAAANRESVDPIKYAERFADMCFKDLDDLGIKRANVYPKASETIPDMITMIQQIIDKGYGYVADGDVYFSVEKFKDYGKLSGQKIGDMKIGARIQPGEKKRSPLDFALWKQAKPGEPSWQSPWGAGRPGWHIECSTMSSKYLGLPFDIHGGGMDLRFPHHENEIAQAMAATGKDFAKYWMHIGLLTVDGEKMSKSLGNIINVKDLLKKWDPDVVRFFYAQAHYRSPPDFNEKGLKNAEKGHIRIKRFKEKLVSLSNNTTVGKIDEKGLSKTEKTYLKIINDFKSEFENAMDDDFNTPQAVSVIFEFVNKSNKFLEENPGHNKKLYGYALEILTKLGNVLTLFQPEKYKRYISDIMPMTDTVESSFSIGATLAAPPWIEINKISKVVELLKKYKVAEKKSLPSIEIIEKYGNEKDGFDLFNEEYPTAKKWKEFEDKYKNSFKKILENSMKMLLEIRENARKKKDWSTADNIRKELDEIGFEIQDTSDGPVWRKK